MTVSNPTFTTPNGFEEIANKLTHLGYKIERDRKTESEDCDESTLGWRCWVLTMLNSEQIYILEAGGDDPCILINLYLIDNARKFREDLLESGGIEDWDGERTNKGKYWTKFYDLYEMKLGIPK